MKQKTTYNLNDLMLSNNRCLEYYNSVLNFGAEDRIPLKRNNQPDEKVCKVLEKEAKDIEIKKPIRDAFFEVLIKAIEKETFYCTHYRMELPYVVEVLRYLKDYEWLIPPFARLNNLKFEY